MLQIGEDRQWRSFSVISNAYSSLPLASVAAVGRFGWALCAGGAVLAAPLRILALIFRVWRQIL